MNLNNQSVVEFEREQEMKFLELEKCKEQLEKCKEQLEKAVKQLDTSKREREEMEQLLSHQKKVTADEESEIK